MNVCRAVIFDADGVLFSTFDLFRDSHAEVLRANNLPCDEALLSAALRQGGWQERFEFIFRELDRRYGIKVVEADRLAMYEQHNDVRNRLARDLTRCERGIKSLLRTLRQRGIRLGLLTSRSRISIESALGLTSLVGLFEIVVSESEVAAKKPSPEGLLEIINSFNLLPGEVFYVGDDYSDMEMAFRAAVPLAFARWGFPRWRDDELEQRTQWISMVKTALHRVVEHRAIIAEQGSVDLMVFVIRRPIDLLRVISEEYSRMQLELKRHEISPGYVRPQGPRVTIVAN